MQRHTVKQGSDINNDRHSKSASVSKAAHNVRHSTEASIDVSNTNSASNSTHVDLTPTKTAHPNVLTHSVPTINVVNDDMLLKSTRPSLDLQRPSAHSQTQVRSPAYEHTHLYTHTQQSHASAPIPPGITSSTATATATATDGGFGGSAHTVNAVSEQQKKSSATADSAHACSKMGTGAEDSEEQERDPMDEEMERLRRLDKHDKKLIAKLKSKLNLE